MKKYHPDANPNDPHAMERMNEINEAYKVLTNPEQNQKASYKQQSHANYSSQSTQSDSTSSRIPCTRDLLLRFGYGVNLPLPFMMLTVGIGEVVSCGGFDMIELTALERYKGTIFEQAAV